MESLKALDGMEYMYYFQYTLNPYDKTIEANSPGLNERIQTFQALSQAIGQDRVIWRYDPILLTKDIDIQFHIRNFEEMASKLAKYTNKVVISIVDEYKKIEKNMRQLGYRVMNKDEENILLHELKQISVNYGIEISSCRERNILEKYGISKGKWIDDHLISELINSHVPSKIDKSQRPECNCIPSIDIGAYNTCLYGCKYCYAVSRNEWACRQYKIHNPKSPMLVGQLSQGDKVSMRKC